MGYAIYLHADDSDYIPLIAPFAPHAGGPLYTLLGLLVAGCRVPPDDKDFVWFFEWQSRFDGSMCEAVNAILSCTQFGEGMMQPSVNESDTWMKREDMAEVARKLLYSKPSLDKIASFTVLDDDAFSTCLKALLYALESKTEPGVRVRLAAL